MLAFVFPELCNGIYQVLRHSLYIEKVKLLIEGFSLSYALLQVMCVRINFVFQQLPLLAIQCGLRSHLHPIRSVLSFAFASATVCHCILLGASAPPHASGLM